MAISSTLSQPSPLAYPLVLSESRLLRYFTFFYMYVMQGIPAGFSLYALANYLAAQGLTPAVVGSFAAIVGIPWSLQFVWGPVIDRFQSSAMGRRRPWVILSQLLAFGASLGILLVDDPVRQVALLSIIFCVHSVFASVQDASVDALAISTIPERERGRMTAFMRGGFLVGISMGSALLSLMLRNYGFHAAALMMSLILLALTVISFFIKEKPEDSLLSFQSTAGQLNHKTIEPLNPSVSIRWIFKTLFQSLTSRQSLLLLIPILIYYSCQAVFTRAYSVHLIQRLGWADTEVSVLQGTAGTMVIVGVILLGGIIADRIGAAKLLIFMMAFSAACFLIFNALSPYWTNEGVAKTGLVIWSVMDPGFSVACMPMLMALCVRQVEGSQFTAYMALVNLSDITGAYLSGQAQMRFSAPVIGLVCGVLVLMALVVAARALWPCKVEPVQT